MTQTLVRYLRNLDTPSLERLAGSTIVRAVQSAFNTNRESELARLVSDRYSFGALENAELRTTMLESLSRIDGEAFCSKLGIVVSSHDIPQAKLIDYFSGPFTEQKSRKLVSILDLTDDYIKRVVQDDRVASEILMGLSHGRTISCRGFLHPYQSQIKDRVRQEISKSTRRMMVQMPTGSGKTATALEIAVDHFRMPSQHKFVVWLVNSPELAEQAFETFKQLWMQKGDRSISTHRLYGLFTPDFRNIKGGFVATTFDKLRLPMSDSSHLSHANIWSLVRNTDLLIVDEAHTSVAETYELIIRQFMTANDPTLVGLTATPARNDIESTRQLASLYSGKLISIEDVNGIEINDGIGYLQKNGYLANLELKALESGVICDDQEAGAICRHLAENSSRNEIIIKQIDLAVQAGEPTLVFSCTKDHVFALIALCRAHEIHAEFIVGDTPPSERIRILDGFRRGDVKVLINHEILATGVDLPNIRRLIITRPIGSTILFSQILGRALRGPKNGGQDTNTIISIRDNLRMFGSANLVFQKFASDFIYSM
jgi:DNA repair protein RadD